MKEIFTDLYKKVLGFFQSHEKETSDREIACSRMKLVLMQDRTNLTPFLLERMRGEMIDVLSKYVEMNKEELELNFEQEGESMALMLSIPVVRAKDEDEINEMIKKEAEEKAAKEAEEEKSETTEDEESEEENAEETDAEQDGEVDEASATSEDEETEDVEEEKECGCSEECDETCQCECHKADKTTEEPIKENSEEQKPSKKKNKKNK